MNNVNIRNLKGEQGAVSLSAGNSVSGNFAVIQCLQDTTLNTLTATNYDTSQGVITGVLLPAGTMLYGKFSQVSVQAGFVVCHKD